MSSMIWFINNGCRRKNFRLHPLFMSKVLSALAQECYFTACAAASRISLSVG